MLFLPSSPVYSLQGVSVRTPKPHTPQRQQKLSAQKTERGETEPFFRRGNLFTSAMLHFVSVGCPPLPLKGTQNTSRDRETPYTLIPPSIQKKVLVAFFIRQRYSDMDVKDGGRK